MRAFSLFLASAFCLVGVGVAAGSGAAGAQSASLVGPWTATDPASGQQDQLVITPETLQFGAGEPPIPYTAEGSGDTWAIYIGGPGESPAIFTFRGPDAAELAVPGGPAIALVRAAAEPGMGEAPPAATGAPEGQDATIGSVIDELDRKSTRLTSSQ